MIQFLMIKISTPVYPCVYREHVKLEKVMTSQNGLSLCVQGTYVHQTKDDAYFRFIPVCTGNILQSWRKISGFSVYPCVYREHKVTAGLIISNAGLSLCVQGTYQCPLK